MIPSRRMSSAVSTMASVNRFGFFVIVHLHQSAIPDGSHNCRVRLEDLHAITITPCTIALQAIRPGPEAHPPCFWHRHGKRGLTADPRALRSTKLKYPDYRPRLREEPVQLSVHQVRP